MNTYMKGCPVVNVRVAFDILTITRFFTVIYVVEKHCYFSFLEFDKAEKFFNYKAIIIYCDTFI